MNGYTPTALNPPAADEVEFSLFGPGFGECAVCHIGSGQWVIVDSCLDPETRKPVALKYLEILGLAADSAVIAIIATHWHDDHILGLSQLLEVAPAARFAITSAVSQTDFPAALAPWMNGGSDLEGKGLAELQRIIKLKRHPIPAGENKIIYERSASPRCRVLALSPSDAALIACISELADTPKTQFCTRMPDMKGNHASVVLSVEVEDRRLLLGGDLQVRADRKFGWLAVVDTHKEFSRQKHHVYKIPHHGSENADHPEIWTHLLEPDPPTAGKFRHPNRTVEKTMREATRSLEVIPHKFGHVRLRGKIGLSPNDWNVEYFGNAHAL